MTILETVLPTFIVIGLAYALQKKKRLDIKPLIETALYLASPCLIFSSLSSKAYSLGELLPIVFSAVTVVLGCLLLSRIIFLALKVGDIDARTLPVVLINSGNLGIPICVFAFGDEAMGIVIMFFVTSAIFTYTLGILLAARARGKSDRPWLEVFKLPLIYAAVLGIMTSILDIEVPIVISRTVGIMGQAAIPLFLISLGMSLAGINARKHLTSAILSASMRIGIGLALGIASVAVLGLDGAFRGVVLLQSSMPSAVASFLLSKKYGCSPDMVAATVLIGTLISVITIPFVLKFVI